MTTAAIFTEHSLNELRRCTQRWLQQLRTTPHSIAPEFSYALGGQGRFELHASNILIGDNLADCRLVYIKGANSEILNTLIYPQHPASLPTFAAELVVINQAPRLMFIDLQVPDLMSALKGEIDTITKGCQASYSDLMADEPAPYWATKYASAGHFYSRPQPTEALPRLLHAYHDYLASWMDHARDATPVDLTHSDTHNETADFKHLQATESPGIDYLNKLFGTAWTTSFIHEFLHR